MPRRQAPSVLSSTTSQHGTDVRHSFTRKLSTYGTVAVLVCHWCVAAAQDSDPYSSTGSSVEIQRSTFERNWLPSNIQLATQILIILFRDVFPAHACACRWVTLFSPSANTLCACVLGPPNTQDSEPDHCPNTGVHVYFWMLRVLQENYSTCTRVRTRVRPF